MRLSNAKCTGLAALLPMLILLAVYTFAALVRLSIGKWPVYGTPDPGDLPQPLLAGDIFVTSAYLLLFPATFLAAIIFLLSFLPWLHWLRAPSMAWMASAVLVVWVSSLDIGGVFSWLMD